MPDDVILIFLPPTKLPVFNYTLKETIPHVPRHTLSVRFHVLLESITKPHAQIAIIYTINVYYNKLYYVLVVCVAGAKKSRSLFHRPMVMGWMVYTLPQ